MRITPLLRIGIVNICHSLVILLNFSQIIEQVNGVKGVFEGSNLCLGTVCRSVILFLISILCSTACHSCESKSIFWIRKQWILAFAGMTEDGSLIIMNPCR
jgi:hypothetical protein